MASLTRYSKGYKIRYRVYYPDGSDRVAFAYRTDRHKAIRVKGQAESLESITLQKALTPQIAVPFLHHRLLTEADLQRWWPRRAGPLQYNPEVLLKAYDEDCRVQCTSAFTIRENRRRAGKLVDAIGNLARLSESDVRTWQQRRLTAVARKTVMLEMDVLRQLLDICQRFQWRDDNPARALPRLKWTVSRLPKALTDVQVQELLGRTREAAVGVPATSLQGQLYRLIVAGIFFGLRRGELQHMLGSDTNGRQVYVQGKTLPDGRTWVPKDGEARVISYPGIEHPIAVVFGETPPAGYVFSPLADRAAPFSRYYFSEVVGRALKPLSRELTLHSLRHTFVTWRLEMGDPMARVQGLTGHADANTLMRYAHIAPDPLADLLPFLRTPPGFPPNPLSKSSSPFPPDKRDPLENLDG